MLYLEQLRNQLPVAREASAQLAKHQQRHGFAYEAGEPDDVMLVVSKEMLRQIDHAIRPHLRPEDAGDRPPRRRRRESRRDSSVIDETDYARRRPSPSQPSGSAVDSFGDHHILRRADGMSPPASATATGPDTETRHDIALTQLPNADSRRLRSSSDGLSSPSTDTTSRMSEARSGTTSPDMDVSR
ncbi:hypothetical protein F5X97DRAFT_120789 [Nemania serpens]|nr:hypothetical protein F5X97DRAFT_120789 [Nemania serpens]